MKGGVLKWSCSNLIQINEVELTYKSDDKKFDFFKVKS